MELIRIDFETVTYCKQVDYFQDIRTEKECSTDHSNYKLMGRCCMADSFQVSDCESCSRLTLVLMLSVSCFLSQNVMSEVERMHYFEI